MRLRAKLAIARGETAGVEDGRKGAIGLFREIEYPFWTAVTSFEQAVWLLDQQRGPDAEPLIAEARQIFTTLDATPWLERVDALGIGTASKVVSAG